jgi:hypothetical protein
MGIVQFHTQGAPRKFVQTPKLLVILYEASSGIRQIFMDGRKGAHRRSATVVLRLLHRPVGKGDTLVVETTHMREDGWLDIIGSPVTDAATITERIRRTSYGRMTIDVTVNDPKAYTSPGRCASTSASCPSRRSSSSSAKRTSASASSSPRSSDRPSGLRNGFDLHTSPSLALPPLAPSVAM